MRYLGVYCYQKETSNSLDNQSLGFPGFFIGGNCMIVFVLWDSAAAIALGNYLGKPGIASFGLALEKRHNHWVVRARAYSKAWTKHIQSYLGDIYFMYTHGMLESKAWTV